jgi:hypothetical protein
MITINRLQKADVAAHLKKEADRFNKRAAFFARPKLSAEERAAQWPHADYCQKLSDRIRKHHEQGMAPVTRIRFTEEV